MRLLCIEARPRAGFVESLVAARVKPPRSSRSQRRPPALGFRFDVDAVIVGDVAHRPACDRRTGPLPDEAISIPAMGVHRAERCPRECPRCRPPFETLLTHQLDRSVEAPAN
jgi:hypothetical protein